MFGKIYSLLLSKYVYMNRQIISLNREDKEIHGYTKKFMNFFFLCYIINR